MNIQNQFIPVTRQSQRPGIKLEPEWITIHSTGNDKSSAQNEANNVCYNTTRQASFHYVVGEKDIFCVLPPSEVAWHAGDGFNGTGNRKSIGIEIVETGDREKVLRRASELILSLMNDYKIDLDHVVQHNRWTGKNCPRILRTPELIQGGMDWEWFINLIKEGTEVEQVFNKIGEVPAAFKMKVEKYISDGIIQGDPAGNLNLTESMIRGMIFTERMINKYRGKYF